MRKIRNIIFIAFFLFTLLNLDPPHALALTCPNPSVGNSEDKTKTFIAIKGLPPLSPTSLRYYMRIVQNKVEGERKVDTDGRPFWSFSFNILPPGEEEFTLIRGTKHTYCAGRLTVPNTDQGGETRSSIINGRKIEFNPSRPKGESTINATIKNLKEDGRFVMNVVKWGSVDEDSRQLKCDYSKDKTITFSIDPLDNGGWNVDIYKLNISDPEVCELPQYTWDELSQLKVGSGSITIDRSLPPAFPTLIPSPKSPLPPCAQWGDRDGIPIKDEGLDQFKDDKGNLRIEANKLRCIKVKTAIGDIGTDPFGFVKSIMSVMLGFAGGIAILLIIVGGYKLMVSQGNPEAVQGAREQITSAIVGLLFIIFSLVILEVIGVDILRIPGFGR